MRIVKSDLSGDYVTSLLTMLEKEGTESEGIISSINDLISDIDKGNLSGPGYESVKARLESYKLLFNARKQVAGELYAGIQSAIGEMNAYMGSDSYLDDDELENLKSTLKSIEINHYNILNNEDLTDEMKKMAWAYQDEMVKLRKEIKKLEDLQPTDASAYGNIAAVQGNISNYQTMVNNVAENGVRISIV